MCCAAPLLTTLVPATSPELPLKVIFLPLGSMGDLATRGKYHKRFHLAYFSNRWVDGGGLGVVLAALDSYQTHSQSTLCSVYIHTVCTTSLVYVCTSVSNYLPFTPSPCPPHSMVHHLTDQLSPVMVDEDAVIVTETAKYVPSPALSVFTGPHEAGHSTALIDCSFDLRTESVADHTLCQSFLFSVALMSSLQPHPQW